MSETLLATKLQIPLTRAESVSRQRLIHRLDAGLAHGLILVSAPPGSGKTTLVSAWAHTAHIPVAWLSLDEGDNDPSRFLAYVTAALGSIAPDLDRSVLPLLQTPQPSPIEVVMTVLINRLAEVSEPFILALDDYHLIDAPLIHDAITFLLEHRPHPMHLILITRADPPLPLARLRARRQLAELRAADLSFSVEESAELLRGIMGLALPSGDIEALVERTEGWAAGLHLAGLSMQARSNLTDFISSFTGSHEYIVDYLVDEVLSQQPEPIRRFLLETSILAHLTGPLCDAVTGREDGTETLATLERRNLFVFPMDAERRWYRYHRLFADVLQQRLRLTSSQLAAQLHHRASQWLAENGHPVEAIRHALAAGDGEMAVTLVTQAAEPMMMRSETATLLHWVEQMPDDLVREHPSLCAYHAWCLLLSGHPMEAVEERLRDVDKAEPVMVLPLRAFIALYQMRLDDAQDLATQALERLPMHQRFMRSIAEWVADIARLMSMKLSDMDERLLQITSGQRTGSVMAIISLCHLAEIRMRQRQLNDAKSLYERALALAVDPQGERLPIAGMALIGLGALAYEWNNLDAAGNYFTEGIEVVSRWSEIGALDGHLGLHLIHCTRGNLTAAREELGRAQELARRFDATEIDDTVVDLMEARLWLAEGKLDRAERWAEERGLVENGSWRAAELQSLPTVDYHLRHHQMLTLARLWMAQQRFDDAAALLDSLLDAMGKHGWLNSRREIEVQALRALSLHASAQYNEAFTALTRALDLAEPDGYVRTLIDEGPPMGRLLHEAAAQGLHPVYVRSLLAAFAAPPAPTPPDQRSAGLVEPLSEREVEVLRLMAEGLTNHEIAERLYLAPATVKVHARNIFGKLGASNRTEAAARARALGLLL